MKKFCKKKGRPLFFTILFLMLIFSIGSVSAADLEVGPSGYAYSNINQAIAAAQPGDTINVHDNNGSSYTYQEDIVINKKNISLVSKGKVTLTQNNSTCILINEFGNGSQVKGFNITSKSWTEADPASTGIDLYRSSNCCILNNTLKGFLCAISSGKNNVISNNTVYNSSYGIEIAGSNISYNQIYDCLMGISDHGSEKSSIIYKNTIYNCEVGIYMVWCDFSLIEGNIINNCSTGWGDYSGNITFTNNTVSNCKSGIAMNANHNTISGNIFSNNQVGIEITHGFDNVIAYNTIQFSSNNGIQLRGSSRTNITQNNITYNSIGILVDEYVQSDSVLISNDNNIAGNDISYNGNGISFGSIFSTPSGNKVHYNRIVGNTYWGLVNYSDEVVDARWNWWGSNADPKNKIYGTTSGGVITNVQYNPWIILTGYAWSTNITAGESADITAYLTTGSNGWPVIGGSVPDGIKVLFSTTKGSIATPKYTTLGLAGSKLITQLSTISGTAVISITVDNQTITLPVTIKGITIANILNTTNYLKKYFLKYHKLPANVTLAGQQITTNQFIKFLGTALMEINGPLLPFGTYRGKISKREYLNMANIINSFIDNNGRVPNYYRSSIGKLSIYRIINLYFQIFKFYDNKNRLPNYVTGI
jgi:parallel beta-helix repeat protein